MSYIWKIRNQLWNQFTMIMQCSCCGNWIWEIWYSIVFARTWNFLPLKNRNLRKIYVIMSGDAYLINVNKKIKKIRSMEQEISRRTEFISTAKNIFVLRSWNHLNRDLHDKVVLRHCGCRHLNQAWAFLFILTVLWTDEFTPTEFGTAEMVSCEPRCALIRKWAQHN